MRNVGLGALAGLVAVLAATVVALLLRELGVPLPLETVSDRFLPLLSVDTFLQLVSKMGGFVAAKKIGFFLFFASLLGIGVALGAAYALASRRLSAKRLLLGLGGTILVVWLVMLALLFPALDSNYRGLPPGPALIVTSVSLLILLALLVGLVVFLHGLLTRPAPATGEGGPRVGRGPLLVGAAGGVLAVAAGGLVTRLYRGSAIGYDGMETSVRDLTPITPNDRFYIVTKNFVDPTVEQSLWRLEISGLVGETQTWSYDDLQALPAVEQETTLECISNGVGRGLISNAVWRGVPLSAMLEAAGVEPGATHLFARGSDGYAHGLTLEKGMEETTLVAYRMNGEPLPDRHGFPARLVVPGAYGETSVKWLDRVKVVDEAAKGFYESQGWRAERIHTMSRIDTPRGFRTLRAGEAVTAKGVAFAGNRGIERVELSTDGGRSWREATLDYPGTKLTWSLWSLDWTPARGGSYELLVRATDGDGAPQESKKGSINPDGASGYHMVEVKVRA